MGYYTNYDLAVETAAPKDELEPVVEAMKTFKPEYGKEWLYYLFCYGESTKWYEYEEDMKEFSSMFPNAIFILTGFGEEPGDIWRAYFKNGKAQVCEAVITYPPYDESKLK